MNDVLTNLMALISASDNIAEYSYNISNTTKTEYMARLDTPANAVLLQSIYHQKQ